MATENNISTTVAASSVRYRTPPSTWLAGHVCGDNPPTTSNLAEALDHYLNAIDANLDVLSDEGLDAHVVKQLSLSAYHMTSEMRVFFEDWQKENAANPTESSGSSTAIDDSHTDDEAADGSAPAVFTSGSDYLPVKGMSVEFEQRFCNLMEERLPPALACAFIDIFCMALQRDIKGLEKATGRIEKSLNVMVGACRHD